MSQFNESVVSKSLAKLLNRPVVGQIDPTSAVVNAYVASLFVKTYEQSVVFDSALDSFWIKDLDTNTFYVATRDEMLSMVKVFMTQLYGIMKRGITMSTFCDVLNQIKLVCPRVHDLTDTHIAFKDVFWSPINETTKPINELTQEDVATIYVPCAMSELENAPSPLFDNYLKFFCVTESGEFDQGMYDQLQEFAGYLLWPNVEQCPCFFLYGEGNNGKSVIVKIYRAIVGNDRHSSTPLHKLMGGRFDMASLVGSRLNASDEAADCRDASSEEFKKMIMGEPVRAENKYEKSFEFRPKAKHIYNLNKMLTMPDVGVAMRRRIMVIPCYGAIKTDTLEDKLKVHLNLENHIINQEFPAIIRWAIDGLRRLKQNNFFVTETEATKMASRSYEAASSSVIGFIEEKLRPAIEPTLVSQNIYTVYVQWCKDNGQKPKSSIRFGSDMGTRFGKSMPKRVDNELCRCFKCDWLISEGNANSQNRFDFNNEFKAKQF